MAAGTSIIARASRNLVNYASLLWNSTARTMKGRRAGRSRVSQVLKAGRGRKKRRRRRGEKEGKKERKGKEDRKACGRERDSTEARNEVESIGWRPSFSRSLHRLGIGADQLRTIRIASRIIKWCSKVSCSSSIYPPIPFVWKKGKKKRKATRKFSFFSLTLSLFFVYHHQSLFRPLLSFPYLSRDRARFRPRRQPANYSI